MGLAIPALPAALLRCMGMQGQKDLSGMRLQVSTHCILWGVEGSRVALYRTRGAICFKDHVCPSNFRSTVSTGCLQIEVPLKVHSGIREERSSTPSCQCRTHFHRGLPMRCSRRHGRGTQVKPPSLQRILHTPGCAVGTSGAGNDELRLRLPEQPFFPCWRRSGLSGWLTALG